MIERQYACGVLATSPVKPERRALFAAGSDDVIGPVLDEVTA